MNEAQRQSYLRALGLTPWVARTTLPGAAPTEPLDWAAETGAGESPAAPVEATPVRTAPGVGDAEQPAREAAPADTAAVDTAVEAPASRAPAARDSVAETPARAPAPADAAGLTFTLEAHLAGDTWVVFQQEDPRRRSWAATPAPWPPPCWRCSAPPRSARAASIARSPSSP